MEGIELDIIYDTPKTLEKEKCDIKYPLTECDIRSVTFYNIDAIGIYTDDVDQSEYSKIYVGGENWVCALPYNELKQVLKEWKTSNATLG